MKLSENWLREWVETKLTREELAHTLTMGGLEIEEVTPVSHMLKDVVVGVVKEVTPHPQAALSVCKVDVGQKNLLNIVCGAPNVKKEMKVAVALPNAILPNDVLISETEIKGVRSQGMLCSGSELLLSDDHAGILALGKDAIVGESLWRHLSLEDFIFDISITPNRGDCLSTLGIAREAAVLSDGAYHPVKIKPIPKTIDAKLEVALNDKAACPRYIGRVIKNVKTDVDTPTWLKEKLRRGGVRSIHPVVDVANYVMLELGQPMHAFDLDILNKGIVVRQSVAGEKIALLDGSEKELDNETLVIADHKNPVAIAGVMGGMDSAVTLLTKNIFLESAYFSPRTVARQRQYYGLSSESAFRFERGVDPDLQQQAIERTSELILAICGGEIGPVTEVVSEKDLPQQVKIHLTSEKVDKRLGVPIRKEKAEQILERLNFKVQQGKVGWEVTPPTYRSDVTIGEDLIEEIARIYGYDKIPQHSLYAKLQANPIQNQAMDTDRIKLALKDLGYHEIIAYSFIDEKLQLLLNPAAKALPLINPITSEMSVMRDNLWVGLLETLRYNVNRQQLRVRLFEVGTVFDLATHGLTQTPKLAVLASGKLYGDQWGADDREVDFFDVKGDLENLLSLYFDVDAVDFRPESHAMYHPGQCAGFYLDDTKLGIIGALHPSLLQSLDITTNVYVFELNLNLLKERAVIKFTELSKYPEIRRDIAILVNRAIPIKEIQDTIKSVAGNILKNVFIFDVYQGEGISGDVKSLAFGLILQHPNRTLVESEVAELMEQVIVALKGKFQAQLRS